MGVLARAGEAHEEGCGGLQPPKGWGGHVGRVDAHIAPQIHPQRLLRPQGGLVNPMIRQLAPSPSNGSSRPMSALWLRCFMRNGQLELTPARVGIAASLHAIAVGAHAN